MDNGYLDEGETIDNGFDPGRSLLPEEVLWIIDELLCREAAWKDGRTLAQTLFTSVHIDYLLTHDRGSDAIPTYPQTGDKSSWTHLVLLAYCVALIISADMTIQFINSQVYYEEEDFNTNTYDRNLLGDVSDETALRLLDRAIKWIELGCTGIF